MASQQHPVRVAVEGCGHGTLHAIYASVEHSSKVKGWDGVDLVIIGGDFQAVRNQQDLNVTAMPAKYRKMADFHEYYSGSRTAPYLTIFIGGNHEASNHLFELYYGGWVAPNIYYLGAANLIRFGPLRISSLSGIWKPYDYKKPHFERLPYNEEEMTSIFHVRELDVRKLLSIRSQVDIGLSHDWPQGVEWLGDHEWLFDVKSSFRADAESGKLGSVAARQCLDRLRPRYWFSAHMHTKYIAVLEHGEYQGVRQTTNKVNDTTQSPITPKKASENKNGHGRRPPATPTPEKPHVSAWQNFHIEAQKADMEERDRFVREQQSRREEEEKMGVQDGPKYVFEETFKKVMTDDSFGREVTSVSQADPNIEQEASVPQFDGCMQSMPTSLKRRRGMSNPDAVETDNEYNEPAKPPRATTATLTNGDSTTINSTIAPTSKRNPDEIDIDMSDDEPGISEQGSQPQPPFASIEVLSLNETGQVAASRKIGENPQNGIARSLLTDESEDGGLGRSSAATSSPPIPSISSMIEGGPAHARTTSHQSMEDLNLEKNEEVQSNGNNETKKASDEISDEMRAQLTALSSDFAPVQKIAGSVSLPLPEAITNTTTHFLALGKCEPYQEFLQLLEIDAISASTPTQSERPFRLQYDPEWLAILRVFALELKLGDSPNESIPAHRGEIYCRDQIAVEEEWIEQHVVKAGLLEVPENFSITAPVYDASLKVDMRDMPREVTNPQTTTFCKLIDIQNPFDVSEEERDARMAQGPRLDDPRYVERRRGSSRGGRGHGHRGGGRGGRGGRRGWR